MATENKRKLAVVTGASSGIGFHLAKQCTQGGFDVIVCADDAKIHDAAAEIGTIPTNGDNIGTAQAVQVDLSTREGVEMLFQAIQATGRPVDALLLNAGVGLGGAFLDQNLEANLKMIALNCNHTVHLAKRVLPGMVARRSGRILITASVASTAPQPYNTVYGATKAFVMAFAEGLRVELKDTGVTVTALQPGATETEFFERANLQNTKVGEAKKDDPAMVAKNGFEAMMAGKDAVLGGGFKSKVEGIMNEVLPETVKAGQSAKQNKPMEGKH
jgi:short-subunit dehydrogenase